MEKSGRIDVALSMYKQVLEEDPHNTTVRARLGHLYLAVGNGQSAVKELLRATETGTPISEVAVDLARARLMGEQYGDMVSPSADASLAEIDAIEGLPPADHAKLQALTGHAFLLDNRPDEAEALYAAALLSQPDEPEALYGQAMLAGERQDPDTARSLVKRALELDPSLAAAWSFLAQVERSRGDSKAAETALSEAIERRDNNSADIFERGTIRVALGNVTGALEDAKQLESTARGSAFAAYLRGLVAFSQKDYKWADEQFQLALSKNPAFMPAVLHEGLTAAALGAPEQARELLMRYSSAFPNDIPALKALSKVELRLRNFKSAGDLAERAATLDTEDTESLEILASARFAAGQLVESAAAVERLAAANPNSSVILEKLATVYAAQGNSEAAKQAAARAKQIEQEERTGPPKTSADELVKAGKLDEALSAMQRLAQADPNNADIQVALARVLLARKETADAGSALRRAAKLDPHHAPAAAGLAQLAISRGALDEAIGYLEPIIQHQPGNLQLGLVFVDLLNRLDQTDRALMTLEELIRNNPTAWQPRASLARYWREHGDAQKALALLAQIAEPDAHNPLVLTELGEDQLAIGDARSAVKTFERLTTQAPNVGNSHYLLARARYAAGLAKEGRLALSDAVKLDPGHVVAKVALARAMLAEQNSQGASKLVAELERTDPERADVLALKAALAVREQRFDLAVAAYEASLAKSPINGTALNLALARVAAGDPDGAIHGLEDWLLKHPKDNAVKMRLGHLAFALGRSELAKQHYLDLFKNGARDPVMSSHLALLSLQGADPKMALAHAKQATALAPTSASALETLGLVEMNLQQYDAAADAFESGIAAAPENRSLHYFRAAALAAMGKLKEADTALTQVLSNGVAFPELAQAKALQARIHALIDAGQE